MFKDGFKESSATEISVEGTTYDAFKTFIRFLYFDELVFNNDEDSQEVSEVCLLADKYQVLRFFDEFTEYYKNWVKFDNMEWLYEIANLYKITEFINILNEWIESEFLIWSKFSRIEQNEYGNWWSNLEAIGQTIQWPI